MIAIERDGLKLDRGADKRRLLVVGIPRSGTTWVARTLERCADVTYVHEPDTDDVDPRSPFATHGLGHLPDLQPGDKHPKYQALWDLAYVGGLPQGRLGLAAMRAATVLPGDLALAALVAFERVRVRRRPPRHQLVKSVRALFSVEWVADHYRPAVVVVQRHPLNMLAGWVALGWGSHGFGDMDRVRRRFEPVGLWPPPTPRFENTIWTLCAMNELMSETAARHPEWLVINHEKLCGDPREQFRALAAGLGLEWTVAADAYLEESNRPGAGWEVLRVASEEIEGWRQRLPQAQVATALRVIEQFETARLGSSGARA